MKTKNIDIDPNDFLYDEVTGNLYLRNKKGAFILIDGKSTNGYLRFHYKKKMLLAHRVIYLLCHGYVPPMLDHIDRNRLNNKISNLRPANTYQNVWNANPKSIGKNTSIYKGVTKTGNRYRVRIAKEGKQYCFGYFETEEEAAIMYNIKAKEFFGEFAYINPIE